MGGVKTTIGYYASGKVSSIYTSGNITVTNGNVSTVSSVSGGGVTFSYGENTVAVRDTIKGTRVVHSLDRDGRELFSYEDTSILPWDERCATTLSHMTGYEPVVDPKTTTRKLGRTTGVSASITTEIDPQKELLTNGGFSDAVGTLTPSGWNANGAVEGKASVVSDSFLSSLKSYCFCPNNTSRDKTLSQSVVLDNYYLDGNVLIASAWAKSSGASLNTSGTGAKFALRVKASYHTSEGAETEDYYEREVSFDPGRYEEWQYVAIPIPTRSSVTKLTFTLDYSGNTGYCMFSNPRLVSVNGDIQYVFTRAGSTNSEYTALENKTVFDDNKTIIQKTTSYDGVDTVTQYYDTNMDVVMTETRTGGGNYCIAYYKYDSKHNLKKAMDEHGVVSSFIYDSYGNITEQKTYHKDTPNKYMLSKKRYIDGYHLWKESDPRFKINGVESYTVLRNNEYCQKSNE